MTQRVQPGAGSLPGLGPYTFGNMVNMVWRFGPALAEHAGTLTKALVGEGLLSPQARFSLHLRLARESRCPFCLFFFPSAARVAGLSGDEIDAALDGDLDKLEPDVARVLAWATSIVRSRGEMPQTWPDLARDMTMRERELVLLLTRLELVVHSVGLVAVPEPLLGIEPR